MLCVMARRIISSELARSCLAAAGGGFRSRRPSLFSSRLLCTDNSPAAVQPVMSSRRRRKPKPKLPEDDKYADLRAAKSAATRSFVPAYPIPSKTRAEADDAEDAQAALICPGCGVYMQDEDPKMPGFFKLPSTGADKPASKPALLLDEAGEELEVQVEEDEEGISSRNEEDEGFDFYEIINGEVKKVEGTQFTQPSSKEFTESDLKDLSDTWDHVLEAPKKREKDSNDKLVVKSKTDKDDKLVVCARCHSLRYYGQVKEKGAENLLPDFDFDLMVGSRLTMAYGKRAVVVMVVDSADFDGSFPRRVARLLSQVEAQMASSFKDGKTGNAPKLIVVATKIDLLPPQLSPVRLEQWIRKRSIMGGAPRPSAIHLVSSSKGWGIQALTERVLQLAGPRGDVWVVGAQNAGKSSLINALARHNVGKDEASRLTEAAYPGTTIGVLKITGLLPGNIKLYDTPGILHPHQLTTRVNEQEFKMVQVRKELKPRTYRIKVGHSIHVGGFLRLDLVEAPAQTIYMTVWASPFISLHMGRTERAKEMLQRHIGAQLLPPLSLERLVEIGKWNCNTIRIAGDSWEASSVDIAVAGLGWVGLGLNGEAVISVWTYEGVAVSTREAMVYDYARIFERPGFTTIHTSEPKRKDVSNAETSFNRKKDRLRKEKLRALKQKQEAAAAGAALQRADPVHAS